MLSWEAQAKAASYRGGRQAGKAALREGNVANTGRVCLRGMRGLLLTEGFFWKLKAARHSVVPKKGRICV